MHVNIEEVQPGTAALEVQVDEQQYGQAINEVMDQLARSIQLPGFRKGKAPRAMVERSVDHTAVRARAMEKVLPRAYKDAIEESGLKPLGEPGIEILSKESDPDLRFRIVIHKQPEITPGPVRDVPLTRYVTQVDEEEVDRDLERLRQESAVFVPAPDSAVQAGDRVEIGVQVWRDGEPLEGVEDDIKVVVGDYVHVPAIDDDLVGLRVGDSKQIDVTYPADFRAVELAGADTVWHINVKGLERRQAPDLNDEFAREAGFESLAEMRERQRQVLEAGAAELDTEALRGQALRHLIETSTVVFPHVLVDQEMESRIERLERSLSRTRHTLDEFAAEQGVTQEQLYAQIHDQAEADVTEFLLLQKVATDEGIDVTPEEVDARIEEEGRKRGARDAIIGIEKQNENRRSTVTFDLRREKVLDLIVANAQITDLRQSMAETRAAVDRLGSGEESGEEHAASGGAETIGGSPQASAAEAEAPATEPAGTEAPAGEGSGAGETGGEEAPAAATP